MGVVRLFVAVCGFWVSSSVSSWVTTPFGKLPGSCVHEIPTGTHVRHTTIGDYLQFPNGSSTFHDICPHAHDHEADVTKRYDGWTSYTSFNSTDPITEFTSVFNVPDRPKTAPRTLYLFPGLQNWNWVPAPGKKDNPQMPGNLPPKSHPFNILQPVLGADAAGWNIASWIVSYPTGRTFYSQTLKIPAQDTLIGTMTQLPDGSWIVDTYSTKLNNHTTIRVTPHDEPDNRLNKQMWAYTSLECYDCTSCDSYPTKPITFSKLLMTTIKGPVRPKWTEFQGKTHFCKEHFEIVSPEETVVHFQA